MTGAGRGLGRAVAFGLARAGADLVLAGRPGSQTSTEKEIRDLGRDVEVIDLDVADLQGGLRVAAYAASKHGVAGITKALANEWGPHGVQVNAIAPGYMATDNTAPLRADPDRSRAILERIPAGRWGTADDIAGAAVFLGSPAADYVNGHVLVVDGGWMAR
ncbi:SDR family oxidoreductase [Pseudonocardia kunmingensis]|uniref:SDR family oxidoreductase n=1 Tax=Pseudonocardia kunmingensis TaxID=630975 RepID=UPI0024823202|nr:SDR family oxidoreductase [Pseudonocardia kunmingensis]